MQQLQALKIEDYAVIGDCETAALVGRNGSIDWLCLPTFSSSACFAALLGTADHGFWKIAPNTPGLPATRRYLPDSMILETTFKASEGDVLLIDFMPLEQENREVIRIVRCLRGTVDMRLDLAIRFDYGRTIPWVTKLDRGGIRAIAGPDMVLLRTSARLSGKGMSTTSRFSLQEGEEMTFTLTYTSSITRDGNVPVKDPEMANPHDALARTAAYWREWSMRSSYKGGYTEAVQRSLMILKALTYKPSGGMVAAVTTSLPEKIGGKRNWDYRYCWLRDTAFTLLILLEAGYEEEASAWRRWLLRAIAGAPAQVQTIYGISGERQMNEWQADWLPGYEHSTPVNIGNAASSQFQLDVFGEVAAALVKAPAAEADIKVSASALQTHFTDHLCEVWDQPDDGIWETRGGRKHFTYSKVMAWVALDRAIKLHDENNGRGDIARWIENRDLIHQQVCMQGFSQELNSFTQSYDSNDLDASCLRIGLVGFLPMDDPRIVGTIEAIEKNLMTDGFLLRYRTDTSSDGLPPGEGVFLACSFWLVTNLWLIGRHEDAQTLFHSLLELRNDVGLLSEEYDPTTKRLVGNFPQALSHIALTLAAYTLSGSWRPEDSTEKKDR